MSDINLKQIEQLLSSTDKLLVKDVFEILGFTRVDNCQRFLRNDKYNYGTIYDWDGKRPTYVRKRLFFDLVHKRLQWSPEWESIFTQTWQKHYESEIIKFTNTNHKSEYRFGDYEFKAAGKFYTYSLSTENIAKSNDLCPYDVFKHCVQKYLQYSDGRMWQMPYSKPMPYITWNSNDHTRRYRILVYIDQLIREFPMDDLQKKRMVIYRNVVEQMLLMQFETDTKKEERQKRLEKKLFGELLTTEQTTELKRLYRKAAFLCHPDIVGGDGETFKKVNKAYVEQKLSSLKYLLNDLEK